jgi:hypothetical protein
MTMRLTAISTATFHVLIVGWALPLIAQQGPCEQITAACKSVGFAPGEAGSGKGLQADCIIPIMQGIAQPAAAALPLPHITPQVIAACKKNRPDFGQQKGIELNSYQFGASNPASAGTGTRGTDSVVLQKIDPTTAQLQPPTYAGPPIPLPPSGSAGTNSNGSLSAAPPPGFDQPSNKVLAPSDSSLKAGAGATPHKFRLIVWTNDRPTVLLGLSGATGPGGTALPTPRQVRAQAKMRKPAQTPGLVIMHVRAGSPAAKLLAQMGRCDPPGCAIEIDQLGSNGQIVQKHRFSAGTAVVQPNHDNEVEEVEMTFLYIVVTNVAGDSALSDSWGVN